MVHPVLQRHFFLSVLGGPNMLGYYNYTVILTYLGMISGFIGITCAFGKDVKGALICLTLAGICDMFDGKIASTMVRTKQERRFGIQIDSLSDLLCFGILPALIVFAICSGPLRLISPMLYTLCALIRLAWFNVNEEERQEQEECRRKVYHGLPVTSAAFIFPFLMGVGTRNHWPLQVLAPIVMLLTAAAFLTPFRLRKPDLPDCVNYISESNIRIF